MLDCWAKSHFRAPRGDSNRFRACTIHSDQTFHTSTVCTNIAVEEGAYKLFFHTEAKGQIGSRKSDTGNVTHGLVYLGFSYKV
jgi:hypothetical protein